MSNKEDQNHRHHLKIFATWLAMEQDYTKEQLELYNKLPIWHQPSHN